MASNSEASHDEAPTSPQTPISPTGVTDATGETTSSPQPQRPSAAHAAISHTVAITPSLTNTRSSQSHSTQHQSYGYDSASRPTTAGSRSHVASLRSPAFLNPMSSQRLQAHRSQWPTSPPLPQQYQTTPDTRSPFQDQSHLDGNSSPFDDHRPVTAETDDTAREKPTVAGLQTLYYEDEGTLPATSRASGETERTEQNLGQKPGITQPRQPPNIKTHQEVLKSAESFPDTTKAEKSASMGSSKPWSRNQSVVKDSPSKEFVSSMRRRSDNALGKKSGHLKLTSGEHDRRKENEPSSQKRAHAKPRKNYEDFEGNKFFWFGGRFQTAKQRPLVLITAFAVVFPTVLFFVFESVYPATSLCATHLLHLFCYRVHVPPTEKSLSNF